MNHFLLNFLSLAAILSGILVIISKNPVISVLFLISVFVNVAGYLVVLGLGFIGISYLIVYVGAIAILFLFVVMMLNLQLAEISAVGKEYTQNLPLGLLIGSIFVFELVSLLPFPSSWSHFFIKMNNEGGAGLMTTQTSIGSLLQQAELGLFHSITNIFGSFGHAQVYNESAAIHSTFVESVDTNFQSFLQIQAIGQFLYTSGSMWLLLSSIILLLAMVGPIILTLLPSREESAKNTP